MKSLIFTILILSFAMSSISIMANVCPLNSIPGIEMLGTSIIPPILVQVNRETAYGGYVSFNTVNDLVCYWYDEPVAMGPKYALKLSKISTGQVVKESLVPTFRAPSNPRFSPDGKTIIFTGIQDNAQANERIGLWKTDIEGAIPQRLSSIGADALFPAWRPDGKQIAYVKRVFHDWDNPDAGADYAIAFLDPSKPGVIQREIHLDNGVGALQYSPDGKWIACTPPWGVGVINVETGRLYLLAVPATLTMNFSETAYEPGIVTYGWLPDSMRMLVTISTQEPKQDNKRYQQIWSVSFNGEMRKICDGFILGNELDGKTYYIRNDAINTKYDIQTIRTANTPVDLSLKDTSGNVVRLANLRGQVVLVDFWASWCGKCEQEVADLIALQDDANTVHAKYQVVGISIDWNHKAVEDFIAKYRPNFPMLYADEKTTTSLGAINGIPLKFIIDKTGKVVETIVGPMTKDELKKRLAKYL